MLALELDICQNTKKKTQIGSWLHSLEARHGSMFPRLIHLFLPLQWAQVMGLLLFHLSLESVQLLQSPVLSPSLTPASSFHGSCSTEPTALLKAQQSRHLLSSLASRTVP